MTVWRSQSPSLLGELLERGWADLRDAGTSFRPNDPTSVLFTVQQAAEKYLKALLIGHGITTSEEELRKKFGHDISKLLTASLTVCPKLAPLAPHVQLLTYSANVRYERARFGAGNVVERMNLAYAICHASARNLLGVRKCTGEQSEVVTPK